MIREKKPLFHEEIVQLFDQGWREKKRASRVDARCDRKSDELVGRGKFLLLRDTLIRILFCVQRSRELEFIYLFIFLPFLGRNLN